MNEKETEKKGVNEKETEKKGVNEKERESVWGGVQKGWLYFLKYLLTTFIKRSWVCIHLGN